MCCALNCHTINLNGDATLKARGSNEPPDLKKMKNIYIFKKNSFEPSKIKT